MKEKSETNPKFLSISQVADMFEIHADTLRNWEKEGRITPLRVGPRRDRKYRPEDIEKIIDSEGLLLPDDDKMTLAQLKQFLWKSADILRGKIDSSDYKKYIFGLLFYKRISDIWDEEYEQVLKEYHDEEIAKQEHNHRFQVPKDCRWKVIEKQAESIGGKLNEIFDALTKANTPKLDRIFDDLDFANRDRFPNEVLQKLINHFSAHNFGTNYISSDLLGDAYEYLIEQFAADAGKKGGEFYTTREVINTIISILRPNEKDHIYDMAVGSGGFLLGAYHYLKEKVGEKAARSLYLSGQEINLGTFAIAKINMFLHGLDGADIRRGDALADPKFLDNQGRLQTFDICVANPPYSIKEWEYEAFASNRYNRLEGYGVIPKKNADFAFVLHMIKSMNEHGRAGIVLPHGVLFRGGAEGKIREQIIKNDLIETIISLPAKLFYGTGIPVAVLILNKAKPKERQNKILFISAENDYQEGSKQNKLRNKDIEKIVQTHEQFRDVEKYARVVDVKELKENEFNLNVRRYVDTSEEEENIDVSIERAKVQRIKKEWQKADSVVEKYLQELGY
ncbi:MAG: type I restriction-modification system subunit M [Candidatus Uhrbacteria bacterium]|nr:type I restriction-modification system subunit M [Candidatus Uhrbacteria bacterium]